MEAVEAAQMADADAYRDESDVSRWMRPWANSSLAECNSWTKIARISPLSCPTSIVPSSMVVTRHARREISIHTFPVARWTPLVVFFTLTQCNDEGRFAHEAHTFPAPIHDEFPLGPLF
jgi:hypothetical protein